MPLLDNTDMFQINLQYAIAYYVANTVMILILFL